MAWTNVEWVLGTALMTFGICVGIFAGAIGITAAFADLLGAEHSRVVLLVISAVLWGGAGAYYFCWGYRFRQTASGLEIFR